MDKFITKAQLGDFFIKMHESNAGKNIEVTIDLGMNKIQVYNKANVHFENIYIIDSLPTLESLVESVTAE